EKFALALLDVVDNLERALAAEGDLEAIREGVRLTLESWKRVMEAFEIERIEAVGQPFDPTHHEALLELPSDEHPRGIVIEQHVPGYKIAGRLLRPAKVVVSKGPSGGQEEEGNSESDAQQEA
ncbi:MAG: nucleotide exchange factor GrpE, partial [Zetaproteobacteria bacterium]